MADEKQKTIDKKQVPRVVKVISVFYYIFAAFEVLFGITFFFILNQIPVFVPIFIILGIIFIGLGMVSFFIARGLWKARQWARIAAIILSCLGILFALFSKTPFGVVSVAINIFSLTMNLVTGGYLIFSKDVKKAFA